MLEIVVVMVVLFCPLISVLLSGAAFLLKTLCPTVNIHDYLTT